MTFAAHADYPDLGNVSAMDSPTLVTQAGFLGAAGDYLGNINGSSWELTALNELFGGQWTWQGKSDDSGFGPFSSNPGSGTSGVLSFDVAQTGLFVLGIKGGPSYSWYLFDGSGIPGGIKSVNFDTFGIEKGNGQAGPGLSHAALYTQIPEPAEYAAAFGALALGAAWIRRRRTA